MYTFDRPKAKKLIPVIRLFAKPPGSFEGCVFAQTTRTVSADLKPFLTPCKLGGNPDCESYGYIVAS